MGSFPACHIHGDCDVELLCQHAVLQVTRGLLYPSHSCLSLFVLCAPCMKAHPELAPLEGRELELGSPAFDLASRAFEYEPCCKMCVDAARIRGARTRREPDPFVVYERSLWPIDSKLSELRALLPSRFTFPAMQVRAGSFRQPVIIEVYGILATSTQDAITALVKTFFEGLTRNQAKLVFLKAMIVEESVSKDGMSRRRKHHRDRERVLRVEHFGSTPSTPS